jgi:hypothetical protein
MTANAQLDKKLEVDTANSNASPHNTSHQLESAHARLDSILSHMSLVACKHQSHQLACQDRHTTMVNAYAHRDTSRSTIPPDARRLTNQHVSELRLLMSLANAFAHQVKKRSPTIQDANSKLANTQVSIEIR